MLPGCFGGLSTNQSATCHDVIVTNQGGYEPCLFNPQHSNNEVNSRLFWVHKYSSSIKFVGKNNFHKTWKINYWSILDGSATFSWSWSWFWFWFWRPALSLFIPFLSQLLVIDTELVLLMKSWVVWRQALKLKVLKSYMLFYLKRKKMVELLKIFKNQWI